MTVTNRFAAMCETVQSPEHQDGELLAGIAGMRKQAAEILEKIATPLSAAVRQRMARKLAISVPYAMAAEQAAPGGLASSLPSWLSGNLTKRNAGLAAGTAGLAGMGLAGMGLAGGSEASPSWSGDYNTFRASQAVDPSTISRIGRAMSNPIDALRSLGGSTNQLQVTGYDANQNARYGSTPYGRALLNATDRQMRAVGSSVVNGGMEPHDAGERMQALKQGINPGSSTAPLTAQQRQLQMRSATPGNAIKRPDVTPSKPAAKFRPVAISKPTDAF